MHVTRDELLHVASLARLGLDEAEIPGLLRDLDRVLEHVQQLAALDLEGVPPLTHALATAMPLRDDVAHAPPGPAALADAPARDGDLVAVPRILEAP